MSSTTSLDHRSLRRVVRDQGNLRKARCHRRVPAPFEPRDRGGECLALGTGNERQRIREWSAARIDERSRERLCPLLASRGVGFRTRLPRPALSCELRDILEWRIAEFRTLVLD